MNKDSLSQDEIDALLNAMPSEQASSPLDTTQGPLQSKPLLSQEELDALLNAASSIQTSLPAAGEITTSTGANIISARGRSANVEKYDFTVPSRVSRDHIRSLRALHNSYARSLSSSFSIELRSVVVVDCIHIEQLTYGEYLASLLEPSCISVFSMKSLKGLGVLEMNPPLVFPMLDKLLGGSGASKFYNRALTNIEEVVVIKLMEQSLKILKESWERSIDLDIKLERLENNPQFIQAASTADPVILILFSVRLDDVQGMMSLCFPFITIQQALASLRREDFPTIIDEETMESYRNMIRTHLRSLYVTVSARYESSQVTLGELLELQKGDIIRLQNAEKDESQIFISGKKKFYGRPGMVNGRRAVQIHSMEKENKSPRSIVVSPESKVSSDS